MVLFTKRRALFVLVAVIGFVTFCLTVDLTGQHTVSRRSEELVRGILLPSSRVVVSNVGPVLQDRPLWSGRLERLRHILSRTDGEFVKRNASKLSGDEVESSKNKRASVGANGKKLLNDYEELEKKEKIESSRNEEDVGANGKEDIKDYEELEKKEKDVTDSSTELFTTEAQTTSIIEEVFIDKSVSSGDKTEEKSNGTFADVNKTGLSSIRTGLPDGTVTGSSIEGTSNKTGLSGNRTSLFRSGTELSTNKTGLSSKTSDDSPLGATNDNLAKALVAALSSSVENVSLSKETIEVVKVNHSTSSKIKDFIKEIPPPTNLPWNKKQLLVSCKDIYERQWVKELQHFLQHSYHPSYPVTLVSTNQLFVESVINWLIHSLVVLENPLRNVLVLTMDEGIYGFLKNKSINVICVPTTNNLNIDKPKKLLMMVRVEAARLLVLRMLNHWGIDVINYDNDAIVLKNPQPLLDGLGEYDVVGSKGFMPRDIHDRWGVTLCFGFFLIRATPATSELY